MLIFGNSVDHLALRNIEVLNIFDKLSLKNTAPYYESIPFVGRDSENHSSMKMIFRKGSLRVKVLKSSDLIRCDEAHLQTLAKLELKKILLGKISEDKFEEEFNKMVEQYKKLPNGGIYHSSTLGYSIQKGQIESHEVDYASLASITRLVAKIVVCCARYFIPLDQQASLIGLDAFAKHAIEGVPLPENVLLRLAPSENQVAFHSLAVTSHDHHLSVDVFLFGKLFWTAILKTNKPIQLYDEYNNQITCFRVILDFTQADKPVYGLGFRQTKDGEFRYLEVDPT